MTELKNRVDSLEKELNTLKTIVHKNHEDLKDQIKKDNDALKNEIVDSSNKRFDEIMNLLTKPRGRSRRRNSSNMSTSSSHSPPPPPPPPPFTSPITSSYQVANPQYQPLMIYPPRAKVELTKYHGDKDQCVAWLNKVEEYFTIYNISTDEEKVKYASMHLEGNAYNWYMWWKVEKISHTWRLFKNDFFKRFQGITEDEIFKKLTRL